MAKNHKQLKDFNRLTNNNFQYMVRYEYDYDHECQRGSDCCDNDYCRCGIIINSRVEDTVYNAQYAALEIAKNRGLVTDFRFYCLERVLNSLFKQNLDSFDVVAGPGYYGEEVSSVALDWEVVNEVNGFVMQLNKKQTRAHHRFLIEQALMYEYGHIISTVEDKNWSYERISIKNIKSGNEEYKKLNTGIISEYADDNYVKVAKYLSCVCKKISETEFVLVDGYHRFAAAKQRGVKSMMVMFCEV